MDTNKSFPGRPNYTGPTKGWFGLIHHEMLCEPSDNVMERVAYVRREKPRKEVAIRLHNMIYLDPVLCPSIANRAPLYADYTVKRATLYADYTAKCATLDAEITAYIKSVIPDCAWDGKTLVF